MSRVSSIGAHRKRQLVGPLIPQDAQTQQIPTLPWDIQQLIVILWIFEFHLPNSPCAEESADFALNRGLFARTICTRWRTFVDQHFDFWFYVVNPYFPSSDSNWAHFKVDALRKAVILDSKRRYVDFFTKKRKENRKMFTRLLGQAEKHEEGIAQLQAKLDEILANIAASKEDHTEYTMALQRAGNNRLKTTMK